jgi:preprotein translocase subunit SecE
MATKMAKSAAVPAPGNDFIGRMKAWPQGIKSFYTDVRMEMKKVTTPSLKEVRATTTVVIIAVFLFGLYFWLIDNAIGQAIDRVLKYFAARR